MLRKGVSVRGIQMASSVDPYGSLAMHCSADGDITAKAVLGEFVGVNCSVSVDLTGAAVESEVGGDHIVPGDGLDHG